MSILEQGKILVTGGAGFIGSALIWALNQRGLDNILVIDYLGKGDKFKNLVPLRFDDYCEADHFITALEQDPKRFKDITAVFHLGACSATTEDDCRYLIENNYHYSRRLAEWALKRCIRFVYASSAATYGDGTQGMDDQDDDLTRLRPLNMYAYSKQLFDCWLHKTDRLQQTVGLKYFNVFGPNENHKETMRSLVHKAFAQIQQTGQVKLFKSHHPDYEDGKQQRDFLYVKDAVAMTLHLAENPQARGLFNIGSGQAHTWIDLVTPIFNALNQPINIAYIDMPEHLRGKYQYHTCASIAKLRAANYTTEPTPLAEAVTDTVQNYLLADKYLGD